MASVRCEIACHSKGPQVIDVVARRVDLRKLSQTALLLRAELIKGAAAVSDVGVKHCGD